MIFIILIFIVLVVVFSYKYYKKCNTLTEKSFYILLVSMVIFIFILYYMDKFNIPTFLGWTKGINSQNWLVSLISFGGVILAEVFGGLVLFFVTMLQIDRNREDNFIRDNEERRINNMPLLQCTIEDGFINDAPNFILETKYDKGHRQTIFIVIKNIGLNSVKKCYLQVEGDSLTKTNCFLIDNQSSIAKDQERKLNIILNLKKDEYFFKFTFYYNDLLDNWYKKLVEFTYKNTSKGMTEYFLEYDDEEFLKERPF